MREVEVWEGAIAGDVKVQVVQVEVWESGRGCECGRGRTVGGCECRGGESARGIQVWEGVST